LGLTAFMTLATNEKMTNDLSEFICYNEPIDKIEFKSSRPGRLNIFQRKHHTGLITFVGKRSMIESQKLNKCHKFRDPMAVSTSIVQTNYNILQLLCSIQNLRPKEAEALIGDADCFIFKKLDGITF
jgi:hypothetical protein